MAPRPPPSTIAELRRRARKRLPQPVFDYVERGSDAELTVRRNVDAFEDIELVPSIGERASGTIDLETTVLGTGLALPVVLAPAGFLRLVHPEGEVAAARAAASAGVPIGLSTLASASVEDVAALAATWFQLYFTGDLDDARGVVDRAVASGCSALVITMDVAAAAAPDRQRGAPWLPRRIDLAAAVRFAPAVSTRPSWLINFLRGGTQLSVPNVTDAHGMSASIKEAALGVAMHQPSWDDVRWARQHWSGPLVVKGILSVPDAQRAADEGVDAIVVSNHGGRAVDGVPATASVLPEIVDAVGGPLEILVDGGVRRGSDVIRALALGARAVLVGRPYIWGLAANGELGVATTLDVLRAGIERTLLAIGRTSVHDVDRSCIRLSGRQRS